MPRGKRETVKLTKRVIDALRTENSRGERTFDSEVKGLAITVYPSGTKVFTLDYGDVRRRRRMTLGRFGSDLLSVDDARKAAGDELAKVREGGDPLEEKAQQRQAPTLAEWRDEYLAIIKDVKRPASYYADTLYLGRACKLLGTVKVKDLSVRDCQRFFASEKGHGTVSANRALASLRTCLTAAWRRSLISENVALKVKLMPENPPRATVLDDKKLARLLAAVEKIPDPHVQAAFNIIVHTGCRKSEALAMKWTDLDLDDLDHATWRLERPKSGRALVRPLPRFLAKLLSHVPRTSAYVVAGKDPFRPRRDLKRWWDRLVKDAELTGITVHDIRRSFGLEVARVAGLHVASKALGHSTIRVTEQVYAPLQDREIRAAAEKVHRARGAKILKLKRQAEEK